MIKGVGLENCRIHDITAKYRCLSSDAGHTSTLPAKHSAFQCMCNSICNYTFFNTHSLSLSIYIYSTYDNHKTIFSDVMESRAATAKAPLVVRKVPRRPQLVLPSCHPQFPSCNSHLKCMQPRESSAPQCFRFYIFHK